MMSGRLVAEEDLMPITWKVEKLRWSVNSSTSAQSWMLKCSLVPRPSEGRPGTHCSRMCLIKFELII